MTIATVVTRGYGSFGSISFVVRQGFNGDGVVQEAPTSRTFFWTAQDRAWEWPVQDRTLEWNAQKRTFDWAAQNRTYAWPLGVTDVTAKWVSPKDDGDITNWTQDFSAEMTTLGDTIATASWSLPAGITNVAESNTTTTASVKISGGVIGVKYDCVVTITTTTSAETFERTVELAVKEVAS